MSIKNKSLMMKISVTAFVLLVLVAGSVFIYINSPLYPANISDETVIKKGAEYKIKIRGITECDEEGFSLATDSFSFTSEKAFVVVGEDGFASTTVSEDSGVYVLGKFNSAEVLYDNYDFCGQEYKTKKELQAFFDEVDRIYNFDIDELSYYISEIINYKKKFYGTATLRIYKGKCVVTSVSVGDEKVLEYKNSF